MLAPNRSAPTVHYCTQALPPLAATLEERNPAAHAQRYFTYQRLIAFDTAASEITFTAYLGPTAI